MKNIVFYVSVKTDTHLVKIHGINAVPSYKKHSIEGIHNYTRDLSRGTVTIHIGL